MHRRDVLRGVAASAVLPAVGAALAAEAAPLGAVRVRPGGAGWPDDAAWDGLKQAVGGRLVKPTYLFAPCETDPKSAACTALFKEAANPYYIGDQAGGTQVSGWLDAWSPKPSVWAVAANSTADVVAAVNFARRHNLRLVVKGGGHSYQGTSNAADSLLVWTRTMNDITLHDAFTPQGCEGLGPPVPAVSIGAGAMWADAYGAVTTKAGRYVQGGGCATVGVAGLIQSGGFGSFSKRYGLAAASLIEAEVVTADGVARVVNARQDPDLLWALKGGGGGSFGVVTRLTLKTHELGEIAGGFDLTIKAASDEAFRRLLVSFVALCPSLINPHWGESLHIRPSNQLSVSMVFQGLTGAEAKAVWKPLIDFAAASPGDFTVEGPSAAAQPMRDWWDFAADRAAHAALRGLRRTPRRAGPAWLVAGRLRSGQHVHPRLRKPVAAGLPPGPGPAGAAGRRPVRRQPAFQRGLALQQGPRRRAAGGDRRRQERRHQSGGAGRLRPGDHRHRRPARLSRLSKTGPGRRQARRRADRRGDGRPSPPGPGRRLLSLGEQLLQ